MHPVRAFRLLAAGLFLAQGIVSVVQAEWLIGSSALLCALVAAIFGMGVRVTDRAELAAVRAAGWRRQEPWAWPWVDAVIGLMLFFGVVSVALPATP